MKTVMQIKSEYDSKCLKIRTMGVTDQELLKMLLSDAYRLMSAETEAVSKAVKSAAREGIQITDELRCSFPPLEDCIKTKGKGVKAYDFEAVSGGTVKLSFKHGEGEQSSYTAYIPLLMYNAIMDNQPLIDHNIKVKIEAGHLFKIPGIRSVQATKDAESNGHYAKGVA
jgi:hypothetical protein